VTSAGGASTGGANSVFLICTTYDPGATLSSVSDNKGNPYSFLNGCTTAGTEFQAIYWCQAGTGGAGHTATANFNTTAYPVVYLIELNGIASTSPVDLSTQTTPYDAAGTYPAAAGARAAANELILMVHGCTSGGTITYSETSAYGFTKTAEESDANNYWSSAVFTLVTASTSLLSATWTGTGRSTPDIQATVTILSFKEATGGTAYTLSADAGSYSVTGAADGTAAALNVNAAAGAVTITGAQAQTLAALNVNAAPGSVAVTGANATTTAALNLNAAPGTVAITGFDATFATTAATAYSLAADPGAYAIAGLDAGLLYTAASSGGLGYTGGGGGGGGFVIRGKHRTLHETVKDWVDEVYQELTAPEVAPAVQKEAAKIVKPFAHSRKTIPVASNVDWQQLARDHERVNRLIDLWQRELAAREADDEEFLLLCC